MIRLTRRWATLKEALRQTLRASATIFLVWCIPVAAGIAFCFGWSDGNPADRASSALLACALIVLPIGAGFVVAATVIAVFCLLGFPMVRLFEKAPKPLPSAPWKRVYDRDLDG